MITPEGLIVFSYANTPDTYVLEAIQYGEQKPRWSTMFPAHADAEWSAVGMFQGRATVYWPVVALNYYSLVDAVSGQVVSYITLPQVGYVGFSSLAVLNSDGDMFVSLLDFNNAQVVMRIRPPYAGQKQQELWINNLGAFAATFDFSMSDDESTLYTYTWSNVFDPSVGVNVTAFDTDDGTILWQSLLPGCDIQTFPASPLVSAQGVLVATCRPLDSINQTVYALDSKTGAVRVIVPPSDPFSQQSDVLAALDSSGNFYQMGLFPQGNDALNTVVRRLSILG